jgi:hypothetical protein
MPKAEHPSPDAFNMSAWERIIKSVTSLFGFVTLSVLACVAIGSLVAVNDRQHLAYYMLGFGVILVLLIVVIFFTAYTQPWLLSIDTQYGKDFPKRVATEFIDLIYPYLSNSKVAAQEQLKNLDTGLNECKGQFGTDAERGFIEMFRVELIRRGEKRVSAIPEPQQPPAKVRRGS